MQQNMWLLLKRGHGSSGWEATGQMGLKVLNNSPFPKFQTAWLWYVEVHTCGQKGLAKQISPAIKAYSTGIGKSWMPKFASLLKQYKIWEWYLDKSCLEKTDSFRPPNQALLNRVNSEQFLQAWKCPLGAGRNDGKSDPWNGYLCQKHLTVINTLQG